MVVFLRFGRVGHTTSSDASRKHGLELKDLHPGHHLPEAGVSMSRSCLVRCHLDQRDKHRLRCHSMQVGYQIRILLINSIKLKLISIWAFETFLFRFQFKHPALLLPYITLTSKKQLHLYAKAASAYMQGSEGSQSQRGVPGGRCVLRCLMLCLLCCLVLCLLRCLALCLMLCFMPCLAAPL